MSEASTTTDHAMIRQWIEARGGRPAKVRGAKQSDVLRIDFGEQEPNLEAVSWSEFFAIFEQRRLVFLHQHQTEGKNSRFNNFIETR